MGSVLHTLVFHLLLWNELLLENAAFASATDAAIYQHTWLPENYTYTNVGVFVDVTTLVQMRSIFTTQCGGAQCIQFPAKKV